MAKLDLGNDEAAIVAGKDIHLPAVYPRQGIVKRVFSIKPLWRSDKSASASRTEIGYSISSRRSSARFDLIVTVASVPFLMRTRVVDRSPRGQVGLPDARFSVGSASPRLAAHEEFPFDLESHGAPLVATYLL